MNQFTFFRNMFELAENRSSDEERLAFYDAICRFAFEGTVPPKKPDATPAEKAARDAYLLVYPILSEHSRKSLAGSSGGKASGEARREAENKSREADREAESEETRSRPRSRKQEPRSRNTRHLDNTIQDNTIQDNTAAADAAGVGGGIPSLDRVVTWATSIGGVPEDFARQLYAELVAVNWKGQDGELIRGWERFFRAAWNREQSRSVAQADPNGLPPRTFTEADL